LWIVKKAADVSFKKTAAAFADKTGVHISRQTVMRAVHRQGELLAKHRAPNGNIPISTDVLYAEYDGFYIHLQSSTKQPARSRRVYEDEHVKKSKEIKVWCAYAGKVGNKRSHTLHWASDASPGDFFDECLTRTSEEYLLEDISYLITSADAAGWCKSNALQASLWAKTEVLAHLDQFHVNQKLYKAFDDSDDRRRYLDLIYSKQFKELVRQIKEEMEKYPDIKPKQRQDLIDYINNNMSLLLVVSLGRKWRDELLGSVTRVLDGGPVLSWLLELLGKRRYKRFLKDLQRLAEGACGEEKERYDRLLHISHITIARIKAQGYATLGTMEGTNAKVYAARLKVWGCSWSEKGAIAMMRIRARIASGQDLIAEPYDNRISDEELNRIYRYGPASSQVQQTVGSGSADYIMHHISPKLAAAPDIYGLIHS
jgi:hypothetical protein